MMIIFTVLVSVRQGIRRELRWHGMEGYGVDGSCYLEGQEANDWTSHERG